MSKRKPMAEMAQISHCTPVRRGAGAESNERFASLIQLLLRLTLHRAGRDVGWRVSVAARAGDAIHAARALARDPLPPHASCDLYFVGAFVCVQLSELGRPFNGLSASFASRSRLFAATTSEGSSVTPPATIEPFV